MKAIVGISWALGVSKLRLPLRPMYIDLEGALRVTYTHMFIRYMYLLRMARYCEVICIACVAVVLLLLQ
jgi:hypothetical protein